jgi:hypothetical protein
MIVIAVGEPRTKVPAGQRMTRLQNDRRAVIKWYRCPGK